MFANPPPQQIDALLRSARIIAVVGLSADPARPSHGVARALQGFGYRIIPVTPGAAEVLGERAVASLGICRRCSRPASASISSTCFAGPSTWRASSMSAYACKVPALWLQDGVIDAAAAARAVAAGIFTVMDRCIFRDRAALR